MPEQNHLSSDVKQEPHKLIMPEFEEPEAVSSSKENYTPSTDATKKPRTRRRSGGFKTEYTAPTAGLGEVDPVEALKREKLSGGAKAPSKAIKERSAPRSVKAEKPERKRERPSRRVSNAQPSPETLAAIQRVEARLDERSKEREAKRPARDKSRSTKSDAKPSGERRSTGQKASSGGIFASILGFFGIGSKPTPKKSGGSGKPSGNRSQGDRPHSKNSGGRKRSQGTGQNRPRSKNGPRREGGGGQRRSDRRGPQKSS